MRFRPLARKLAERKFFQAVEAKKLRAEGVEKKEAEEQAEAAAERLVEQAAEIKAADALRQGETTSRTKANRHRRSM